MQPNQAVVVPVLLTVEQAAEYLGASNVWSVRRLIQLGRLPVVRVGKRLNIPLASLDEYIQANTRRRGVSQ